MDKDHVFLKRALELAAYGMGRVSPNPMVGCVIVHENKIIGEGWHKFYGGPHAEVNAIDSVKDKSLLKESTLYVNLEPCSHFGKTPPCAALLIKHQLKKVVIGNLDINPLVGGNGIKMLKEKGIEVVQGVLSSKGDELNRRFFTFHKKKRPYIILKWAETADGFIARKNFDSKWISNELSRKLVHKWRSEEDAILVGTNTALYDNPSLNVRDWTGKNPIRLVIDRELRLPENLNIFMDSGKTIIYNNKKSESRENLTYLKLRKEHFLRDLMDDLYQRMILSVIIEGGGQVLEAFIAQNLWDEARVFKSNNSFGSGIPAPVVKGRLAHQEPIADDHLFFYNPL